ncbi:hypothetical protein L596_018157 [Steinernema carpocapsae]|uniref:Skp1-related protein n=1 Tax=Steinernema carpocapsae TaxID=34508 RepID=A0A4U5N4K7_STECR|nr:hypothetical protein L596_018157 [Steinernema carpocapsae]
MQTIKLQAMDGDIVEVDREAMRCSGLIQKLLEIYEEHGGPDKEIPVEHASGPVLRKIVVWCEHHKDDATQDESKMEEGAGEQKEDGDDKKVPEDVAAFDKHFVRVEQNFLMEMLTVANYMEMEPLMKLLTTAIAQLLKGKKAEVIREQFNVTCDFTPERLKRIEAQNAWVDQKEK